MPVYEVNIANRSHGAGAIHWGKVTLGSCNDDAEASRKFDEIVRRFPPSEGWSLSLTCWRNVGTNMMSV